MGTAAQDRPWSLRRRLGWHAVFVLPLAVIVWGAWFGTYVSCSNDHSCGVDCRPCRHIAPTAVSAWVVLLLVSIVGIVAGRRPTSGFAVLYLALGIASVSAIVASG